MLLEYSFRKSFLISSAPLKPDYQPIQQLLPPYIPSSSLVKTYSFSQLSSNNLGQTSNSNFIVNNNSKKNLLHVNNTNNPSNSSNINNESSSFNEPYSYISLYLPPISKNHLFTGNNKRIEYLYTKNQQLITYLKAEKYSNKELKEYNKKLRYDYESLLKIHNLKQKDSIVKDYKKEFVKKIGEYEQELALMKKEIGQKNEQLTVYEMRSEESRRLLQKLNENINKKYAKLVKDKEIVTLELERVNRLLYEAKAKYRQKNQQILYLYYKYKRCIEYSLSTSHEVSYRERNTIVAEYYSKLQQKITEINQLMDKFTAIENEHHEELNRLRDCLSEHESNRTSMSEGLIRLQEDHVGKEQEIYKLYYVIAKLEEYNGQLREYIYHMTHELQSLTLQYQTYKATYKSKQYKLYLHLTNTQFLIKYTYQKIYFLYEYNQRTNQLVNYLKYDKRMLQRYKYYMKTTINEKTSIIYQLKSKLYQSREMEIKYKAIIDNYEKEQYRVYEHENYQANAMAIHYVKIKSQNIEIEKLNLIISYKQSELNQANLNTERYKKIYQQYKLMLAMYKYYTAKVNQKTEAKWNELKHYYETYIYLLYYKIKDLYTNISSTYSRTRIRNLFNYSFIGNILQNSDVKARIVTSRIVTGRQRHNDKEESYINELNMLSTERENHYRSDSGVGDKKRIQLQQQYKVGDDDDEYLKENYWHGLNNDSIDHDDYYINKN